MKRFRFLTAIFLVAMLVFGTAAMAAEKVPTIHGNSPYRNLNEFMLFESYTTGDIYYVDSNVSSEGDGTSWARAKDTLDEAAALCTANNGDVIFVAPGHAETLSAADAVDLDVAGITVIGIGGAGDRPAFTFSATAGEFVIGAANITIDNLEFIAGISSITMGISIEAAGDDFVMRNCVFPKPTTNSWEFLDAIDVATGANNITIENCVYFNDEGGAAPNHFIDAGNGTAGPERLRMIGNYIKGDFAVSAIWSDEPCDEVFIANNTIINHTTGQHCIEFTDTGTGAIVDNRLFGDTEGAILDPGSMYIHGNTISTAIDLDGLPRWVIDNGLNHLLALDGATQVYPENAVDDSILAKILSKSDPTDISDYDCQTDSLEAIADALAVVDGNVDDTEYWQPRTVKVSVDEVSADLFDVDGGAILILNFFGLVTADIGANATTCEINLDADTGWTDYDFTTAVAITSDAAGTRYVFTAANEAVLTPLEGADGGASSLMTGGWLCGEGMVEQAMSADPGGAEGDHITWYMRYVPLETGVTVTAQ